MRFSTLHLRAPFNIFRVVSLLILAVGLAIAPPRIAMAQEAPAAQTQPAVAQNAGSGPTEEKAEDSATEQFRHSSLVKSAAKVLHMSVEATARTFEVINFAIIVIALGIPLYRFMPKYLRGRAEKVRTDIESARKTTEDAQSRLSAVEAKLASLGQEIAKFRNESEKESAQDEARIKAALEEERGRIVAAAEQEIGVVAAQARRSLRHFAADLAIDQAARQIDLTPEMDRALIAEFVGDVAMNGKKGGQN